MGINDIIKNYTSGNIPVEEANAALEAEGAGYHFEPGRNALSDEDIAGAVGGPRPQDADGWGLLDTGTGTLDKVLVTGGKLDHPVNQVLDDGITNMRAYVYIGGYTWEVYGDTLGEVWDEGEPWWAPRHTFAGAVPWRQELPKYIPEKDMMFNRPKYHGQEVVKGAIRYIYAEDGTAQYQPKSMRDYDKDHGRA